MRLDELFKSDDDNKIYKQILKKVHTDRGGDLTDIQDLNHARDINDTDTLGRLKAKYIEEPKEEQSSKEQSSDIGGIPLNILSKWCDSIKQKFDGRMRLSIAEIEGIPTISIMYTTSRIFRKDKSIIATVRNAHSYSTQQKLYDEIMSQIDKKL